MKRRSGMTLTEVLVTLAILAFGVLAILTLFPLAASQMAIAVREDRSAQLGASADGYLRAYWKSEIVEKNGTGDPPIFGALDNPNNSSNDTPRGALLNANPDEVSYPVIIDPMGFAARGTPPYQAWMGDSGGTNVPRRTLQAVTNQPAAARNLYAFRLCSQMDGIGFDENGHPQNVGTPLAPVSDREIRYNAMWVIQRPNNSNRFVASLSVVVFDNRPNLYAPVGAEQVFGNVRFIPNTTSVDVPGAPDIKPGRWVMDATIAGKMRHANFYQVVSVTPNGGITTLELQVPIKKSTDPAITGVYTGTLVVPRGVSGVYTRPMLTAE